MWKEVFMAYRKSKMVCAVAAIRKRHWTNASEERCSLVHWLSRLLNRSHSRLHSRSPSRLPSRSSGTFLSELLSRVPSSLPNRLSGRFLA